MTENLIILANSFKSCKNLKEQERNFIHKSLWIMFIFGDIKQVIELQRDLSFAEQIAMAIIGITVHRDKYKNIPVLLNGSDKESIFEAAYIEVKEKMEEYDKLKEENEKLKESLKKYDK